MIAAAVDRVNTGTMFGITFKQVLCTDSTYKIHVTPYSVQPTTYVIEKNACTVNVLGAIITGKELSLEV